MILSCAQVARIVDALGRTNTALALGVSAELVMRWCDESERPTPEEAVRVTNLAALLARAKLLGGTRPVVTAWMVQANDYLKGSRPVDVFSTLDPGTLMEALDATCG